MTVLGRDELVLAVGQLVQDLALWRHDLAHQQQVAPDREEALDDRRSGCWMTRPPARRSPPTDDRPSGSSRRRWCPALRTARHPGPWPGSAPGRAARRCRASSGCHSGGCEVSRKCGPRTISSSIGSSVSLIDQREDDQVHDSSVNSTFARWFRSVMSSTTNGWMSRHHQGRQVLGVDVLQGHPDGCRRLSMPG